MLVSNDNDGGNAPAVPSATVVATAVAAGYAPAAAPVAVATAPPEGHPPYRKDGTGVGGLQRTTTLEKMHALHWHKWKQKFDLCHRAMLSCGMLAGAFGTVIVVLMVVGFFDERCIMTPGQRDTCEEGCLYVAPVPEQPIAATCTGDNDGTGVARSDCRAPDGGTGCDAADGEDAEACTAINQFCTFIPSAPASSCRLNNVTLQFPSNLSVAYDRTCLF
jgi:hypothetical protein